MKKKFKKIRGLYSDSKYASLITVIIIYIFIVAVCVYAFETKVNKSFASMFDAIWWTIVTFSTTGYGDKVPETFWGKIVAILTIFSGLGIVSILSGTMASVFVDRDAKTRRGLVEYSKLKNHIVICGWKDQMDYFIQEILRFDKKLDAELIVIISNVEQSKLEALREYKDLKMVKFIRGDYFSENTLKRAHLQNAKKVMILADKVDSSTTSEVDSKTVITVLTVKNLAKDIYVCAELLDNTYENYLKQAMCDEIFFPRDYNRVLLGNSAYQNGISHIFYELLGNTNSNSMIITELIPSEFCDKSYKEYREKYNSDQKRVLMGVLENTGTPRLMKKEALREAQKTSDISKLISNLQDVKQIEINRPVLLPGDDYKIKKYSMGIFVERIS